ncbi:conserved oligomeric Golgi complex subunit 2-like isoform X3 [Hydractinia symbiolongicarpus]|uniref:conserved oligomeric Golgi complex subunit 2-like isoform X3 n=1 Tax=Hydractinia symbiolongicarpus TaxID=13093 RepID=UPI00254E03DC|nr:conserved oligomeric Golgi complex subunit 2-like isoform X3 [Hydractinia symbiolongicarpus]
MKADGCTLFSFVLFFFILEIKVYIFLEKDHFHPKMNKFSSPRNLCFKEDEFIDLNFSVDNFVATCKDRVSMAVLREDLEAHYKNIQLALIELINRDYADFVSLSSNLIGTEKSIDHINTPLGQLKEKILSVKDDLSGALAVLKKKLEQRKKIKDKKSRLHHLIMVVHSAEKIEKIITADPKSHDMEIFMSEDRNHPGHFLERIAGEFNQLQFHVNQSKGHPIIETIRPRVALITSKLQENLEVTFEQGILNKQPELTLRCLRTYALIDKTSYAETLFRHLVVEPFVTEVVSDTYLKEHGIENLCKAIIHFIDEECSIVLALTSETRRKANLMHDSKDQIVKGFNFLLNSVWVELVHAFEEKLPLIFSPGNPDVFLRRYKIMMKFLDEFEDRCVSADSFKNLRIHPTFNSFMIKWSLPVYFQIRFQEIGGKIEVAVHDPFGKSPKELFMTNIVGSCWLGIVQCWKGDVYIPALKGRFWKLCLQVINRLSIFFKSTSEHTAVYKDITVENLSHLLGDGLYFLKKVEEYYKEVIDIYIKEIGPSDTNLYKDALNEACNGLKEQLHVLDEHLVKRVAEEGSTFLDNVKNVPRLYRRTNKEPPQQPSSYVSAAFTPLTNFKKTSSTLDERRKEDVVKSAVIAMTSSYYCSVNELLTAIKKTEDSLQRLKQQRKAVTGQCDASTGTKTNEISDENKIRKQIYLDAEEFGKQVPVK